MADIMKMIKNNDLFKILIVLLGIYLFMTYVKKESLENVEMAQPETPMVVQAPVEAKSSDLKPNDLLPQYDDANEFAQQNPVSNLLKEQNFIVSGHHIGINTVMQSNKIPYHDLRSAPPIPKETISPFLNSSFEAPAGSGRRMLEIGAI
jgi:hypothetical protein